MRPFIQCDLFWKAVTILFIIELKNTEDKIVVIKKIKKYFFKTPNKEKGNNRRELLQQKTPIKKVKM